MEELKTGRVLVDFYADWCGPCKMMKKHLEEFDSQVEDVKVVKVNVDEHADMAQAFGVRGIPTVFYMKDGEVINRRSGIMNLSQLIEFTQE